MPYLCFQLPHLPIFFRKHVKYEEDKNKVPMNKSYNIQNTNICNGIFHISFFKALLLNGFHWSTAVRFWCGVLVWILYCLTSNSSLCSWIEYQEIVICILCTTEGQYKNVGAVVIKLPVQSVHITSKVVSFNPADGEVYSIQHYVIEFVSDLQQGFCFL